MSSSSGGQMVMRCLDMVAFPFPRCGRFAVRFLLLELDGDDGSSLSEWKSDSEGLSAKAFVTDFSAFLERFWLALKG